MPHHGWIFKHLNIGKKPDTNAYCIIPFICKVRIGISLETEHMLMVSRGRGEEERGSGC